MEISNLPGVYLRVKRRRNDLAPHDIVLEASSKAAAGSAALAADFSRCMGLAPAAHRQQDDVVAAPPKKRCRFVLFTAAGASQQCANVQQALAAAAAAPVTTAGAAGKAVAAPAGQANASSQSNGSVCVLDLDAIRSKALDAANQSSNTPAAPSTADSQQQQRKQMQDANGPQQQLYLHTAAVYVDMVQQFLQEHHHHHHHQQQPAPPANPASSSSKGPDKRRNDLRQHAAGASSAAAGMTAVGITDHLHQQQQPEQPVVADTAASEQHSCTNVKEYVYDVYVPAYDTDHPPGTISNQEAGRQEGNSTATVQVWEEDLPELGDLWGTGFPVGAAPNVDDVDSEDSNAEDHYANSYPDDVADSYDEYNSNNNSLDSSENADIDVECWGGLIRVPEGGVRTGTLQGSLITSYSVAGNKSPNRHVTSCVGDDIYENGEEFDVDDYVSSEDEQLLLQEKYGEAGVPLQAGGAAWRAILAEQCMPGAMQDSPQHI